MPVVEVLRRDVPKPAELPVLIDGMLLWPKGQCAMGLHPKSTHGTPAIPDDFAAGECAPEAVNSFCDWFDDQTDPQATVDAIWGTS